MSLFENLKRRIAEKGWEKEPTAEEKKRINRRRFLVGSAAALTVGYQADNISGEKIPVLKESGIETSDDKHIFSNPEAARKFFEGSESCHVYLRTVEENFINLGVHHNKDLLKEQLFFLGPTVKSSDLVLLELGPKGGYFDILSKNAEDKKVKSFNIDQANGYISQVLGIMADTGFCWNIFVSESGDRKKVLPIMYGNGTFSPIFIDSILSELGRELGINKDLEMPLSFSHVIDGRNIFMTLAIMKVRKENPNARIVCVTGDVHAIAIDKYLKKENEREFKGLIYSLLYGWRKAL
jgi:hypothetical protein